MSHKTRRIRRRRMWTLHLVLCCLTQGKEENNGMMQMLLVLLLIMMVFIFLPSFILAAPNDFLVWEILHYTFWLSADPKPSVRLSFPTDAHAVYLVARAACIQSCSIISLSLDFSLQVIHGCRNCSSLTTFRSFLSMNTIFTVLCMSLSLSFIFGPFYQQMNREFEEQREKGYLEISGVISCISLSLSLTDWWSEWKALIILDLDTMDQMLHSHHYYQERGRNSTNCLMMMMMIRMVIVGFSSRGTRSPSPPPPLLLFFCLDQTPGEIFVIHPHILYPVFADWMEEGREQWTSFSFWRGREKEGFRSSSSWNGVSCRIFSSSYAPCFIRGTIRGRNTNPWLSDSRGYMIRSSPRTTFSLPFSSDLLWSSLFLQVCWWWWLSWWALWAPFPPPLLLWQTPSARVRHEDSRHCC